MKTTSNMVAVGALAALGLLGGCAASAPETERNFGNSVRASVAAQVADPAASANANPVTGIDGRAAKASQQQYEQSFIKPPAPQSSMTTGSAK